MSKKRGSQHRRRRTQSDLGERVNIAGMTCGECGTQAEDVDRKIVGMMGTFDGDDLYLLSDGSTLSARDWEAAQRL